MSGVEIFFEYREIISFASTTVDTGWANAKFTHFLLENSFGGTLDSVVCIGHDKKIPASGCFRPDAGCIKRLILMCVALEFGFAHRTCIHFCPDIGYICQYEWDEKRNPAHYCESEK